MFCLVLLVTALDLDPRLQADGEPLDLLRHGPALDPHLALHDPARHDVHLGELGLHRRTTGTQAREQLLEAHVHSFLVLTPTIRAMTVAGSRARPSPVPSDGMTEGPDRTPLPARFFDRPVLDVAPDLLGRTLVRHTDDGPVELRLTEVEAYAGEADPGSHAYRGRTARNAVMFGPPGHTYVYFTYGMWHCLNLVCGPEGHASGVLLRAGEIDVGADLARERRLSARNDKELAKGPARLATALDVDRALTAPTSAPAPTPALPYSHGTPPPRDQVRSGPRTGVGGDGAHHPWRFWIDERPHGEPVPRPRSP